MDSLCTIYSYARSRMILSSNRLTASEIDIVSWDHSLGYVEEHQGSHAILLFGAAIQ